MNTADKNKFEKKMKLAQEAHLVFSKRTEGVNIYSVTKNRHLVPVEKFIGEEDVISYLNSTYKVLVILNNKGGASDYIANFELEAIVKEFKKFSNSERIRD